MTTALEKEKQNLWHHPNFLKLWASETISQFGTQFSGFGIPFTALLLTSNPLDFGILNATALLAFPLFALFIGVYVDRHHRRRIMVSANLGRGILLALIPLAAVTGALRQLGMPLLYLVSFSVGVLTVFFDVSYQAILPSLVERDQLVEGNSKLEASRSTAQVAGPSIAGIAVQALSAPLAIAVDAVSYFGSASFLGRIKKEETVQPRDASVMHDLKEGLSVVLKDARLRSIAGCTSTANFFSSALFAILILYLVRQLNFTAAVIGLIFTIGSTGAFVGIALAGRLAKRIGVGPAIVSSILFGGIGSLPFYIMNPSLGIPLLNLESVPLLGSFRLDMNGLLMMIAIFAGGITNVVYNINQVSLRQALVPIRLQGRMNASMRWIVWGTIPAGSLAGGILGSLLGLRPAIAIAVLGASLAFLWVFLSPVRSLKRIPEPLE
jgi:MFS family permease